jgi:acetylglutamate kinase
VEPVEAVLRFLESVGRRSEAEFYVQLFQREPKEQFAAISVDANVARYALDAVALHLRFLASLGLAPTVVLGLFEPTGADDVARRMARRLLRSGISATCVVDGPDVEATLRDLARAGTIPILSFPPPAASSTDAQAITRQGRAPAQVQERVVRLGELLTVLSTRKLLFLHRPGGLRHKGLLVPVVNLTTDAAALLGSKELSRKEKIIVAESRRLVLEAVPHKLLVSITSPFNLLRELFTVKGAGTLLRRGQAIVRHAGLDGLDHPRLGQLITSAFGRPPKPQLFERQFSSVWLAEDYRGAALLQETPLGAYLSKFAVDREAQGEGVGRDLWDAFVEAHPVVFWRARPQNPIVEWYTKQCDALIRTPEWTLFFRGLTVDQLPAAAAWALAQPIDLPPLDAHPGDAAASPPADARLAEPPHIALSPLPQETADQPSGAGVPLPRV